MDLVGVMEGAWVETVPGVVGVAEGGTSVVGMVCACTVSATAVAMTDPLSEDPQAPSRMLVTISKEIKGKVFFIFSFQIALAVNCRYDYNARI